MRLWHGCLAGSRLILTLLAGDEVGSPRRVGGAPWASGPGPPPPAPPALALTPRPREQPPELTLLCLHASCWQQGRRKTLLATGDHDVQGWNGPHRAGRGSRGVPTPHGAAFAANTATPRMRHAGEQPEYTHDKATEQSLTSKCPLEQADRAPRPRAQRYARKWRCEMPCAGTGVVQHKAPLQRP